MNEIKAHLSRRYYQEEWQDFEDQVVREEALEIRIAYGPVGQRRQEILTVTLRTPGRDEDLAIGLLLAEGIIGRREQVGRIEQVSSQSIHLELDPQLPLDLGQVSRRMAATASCGMCGKSNLDGLYATPCYFPLSKQPQVTPALLLTLGQNLKQGQTIFRQTGGIHAAALFDTEGDMLLLREDVGRHNALDKLLGVAFSEGRLPLKENVVMLSGRIGYELVHKGAMAGLAVLAAVGAPTDMAIEAAEHHGMTLIGFLREKRFNVYTGEERINGLI